MKASVLVWVGRGLSLLVMVPFVMSAAFKFLKPPMVTEGWAKSGWPESMLLVVAVLEVASMVAYVIPQTAVLGAILLTGYLGGAISSHLRLNEDVTMPVILGVMLWFALYCRDARLRDLIPIRRLKSSPVAD